LLDVREAAEYKEEYIDQSKNISLSKADDKAIESLALGNKKLIIYCKSGKRSAAACEKLSCESYLLDGGLDSWKENGLPVKMPLAKKICSLKTLPISQQVHLTFACVILLGLLINSIGLSFGLILPLIVGLGLLNMGLTGCCYLAKLMAKMPWNK
jgi:rhodanese-related sulfurtransferase